MTKKELMGYLMSQLIEFDYQQVICTRIADNSRNEGEEAQSTAWMADAVQQIHRAEDAFETLQMLGLSSKYDRYDFLL